MRQQFSFQRIGNIIKRDVILLRGSIMTTLAVVSVIFLFGFLIGLRKDHIVSKSEFLTIFSIAYILVGLLLTFSIFKEAHNQKLNHFYLSLPVSPLERIIAIWLTTSVIYTVLFSILVFLIGQISIIIGNLISDTELSLVGMFSREYWQVLLAYFLIQPSFLFGAIAFNKNSIGKTILAVLLTAFAILLFNVILCFSFYGGTFDVFASEQLSSNSFELTRDSYWPYGKWMFMFILGPMMLLAAYFKLTEKQV